MQLIKVDCSKEEAASFISEIINLIVLIVLAAIVLNFASDRTFVETYAVQHKADSKELRYDLSLDSAAKEAIEYFEKCMENERITELDSEEINDDQKEAAMQTKDYKKYSKHLKTHKNTVGWISIGGLIVDYPIMYSKYKDYYLQHNVNDKKDIYGSIYLEEASGGEFGQINIIHGHNMRDGKMFGELDKYKEQKFLDKHLYFNVTSSSGTKQYRIFSVTVVDGAKESIPLSFEDNSEYKRYVKRMNRMSMFPLDYSENPDSIVILNTCSYEFTGAHFLVLAEEIN